MNFLNKLERKFGRFAIKNLTMYLMIAYAIGYVLLMFNPDIYSYLVLNPALVVRGQVWRLFTWICTVPQDISFFLIFMFMFYYWIGTTLERNWGTFRYNLYMFSGYFSMTIGAMVIYFITLAMGNPVSMPVSTYYINLASFLAFATLFPNVQVMFMMIIPIKIKWLAIADAVIIGLELISYIGLLFVNEVELIVYYGMNRSMVWAMIFSIIVSVLNFLVFFLLTRNYRRISPAEIKRKRTFQKAVNTGNSLTRHKCAICGRTEKDDPNLQFRFCSKCEGNYEYCQDHLFTHEHIHK